jgi:integrase
MGDVRHEGGRAGRGGRRAPGRAGRQALNGGPRHHIRGVHPVLVEGRGRPGPRPETVQGYRRILELHAVPTLGPWKLRKIRSTDLLALLAEKLNTNVLARGTVGLHLAILRSLFQRATTDGLLPRNPAAGLGRELNLGRSRGDKEEVLALTREERDRLLTTIAAKQPRLYVPVVTMTHAGLRIAEVAGLEWTDVDLDPTRRTLRVQRMFRHGKVKPRTKSGAVRQVRLTPHLRDVLARHAVEQKKDALRCGRSVPAWVFSSLGGTRLDVHTVQANFKAALKAASLPPHHSPHSCRHTFATMLLQAGVPIQYVQKALGHASIGLTVDTYGRWQVDSDEPVWTPKPGQFWVDVLDTPPANGSTVVATMAASGEKS